MKTLMLLSLIFTTSMLKAESSYKLSCSNNEIITDLGQGRLALTTNVTVIGPNDYYMKNGFFKFFIQDDWTDQKVRIGQVKNLKEYRPRVYTGHAKFPNISHDFIGKVDVILPHAVLSEGIRHFIGIFILTWVEDHWGGTVAADCELTPM